VASPTLVIGIDLLLIFLEQMVVCPLIESVAIIRNPQRAGRDRASRLTILEPDPNFIPCPRIVVRRTDVNRRE
jgi:hypothetical protein